MWQIVIEQNKIIKCFKRKCLFIRIISEIIFFFNFFYRFSDRSIWSSALEQILIYLNFKIYLEPVFLPPFLPSVVAFFSPVEEEAGAAAGAATGLTL